MISLKKLILENAEYSLPSMEFDSAGDSFCVRGAKTKTLSPEHLRTIRDTMMSNPTPSQEKKIKDIMVKSLVGLICRDAGLIANRYKQHGITRDDLISAGLIKMLQITWPRIDWGLETLPQTFIMKEIRGHMTNFANKQVKKQGLTGVGDKDVSSMLRLDAPISGKEGDEMTAYDIIGGTFDNEFEEADFMQRLYKSLRKSINPSSKLAKEKDLALQNFLGLENERYTGSTLSRQDLSKEIGTNPAGIWNWYNEWSEKIKRLKEKNPNLFNENKK